MAHRLSWIIKHTAHTTTIIFIAGFIFDMIMLPDIDHAVTRYIGAAHILIVAFFIMFREFVVSRNSADENERRLYSFSSFFISFSSGAALSFIVVYALRAATFSVSWPLFVLLLLCIIANELVSSHDFRLSLDMGILFIATLFFIIFNVPLIVKVQNDTIFIVSVIISACISFAYVYFLSFTSESAHKESGKGYALSIGIPMFVFMLYFLNMIPAVPLSLKNAGMYHNLYRNEQGNFIAQKENDDRFLKKYRTSLYHKKSDDTGVYFFSSIDTPAKLTAPISHIWEKYNNETKKWEVASVISFDIEGGREDGYRAYSKKENITEGLWRITVKIGENRIIGREKFLIINNADDVKTEEVSL